MNDDFSKMLEHLFGGQYQQSRNLPVVVYGGSQAGKTTEMVMRTNTRYGKVDQMDLETANAQLDQVNERADALKDHIAALHAAGIDEYADGTVIRFTKPMVIRGIERSLTYVAVKKADAWFVTGASGPNEVDWNTLVLWAGPDNIADREIVKEWESR